MNTDLTNILKNDLTNGVNLLVGAGFSKLAVAGPKRAEVPTGNGLRDELVAAFDIKGGQALLPLPKLYSILMAGAKRDAVIDHLTSRFQIKGFDDLYRNLENIKIKNVITTNIDDLFYNIFAGGRAYVHDMIAHGPDRENDGAVNYLPIHGSVKHPERGYTFTAVDLASAYKSNISGHETLKFLLASAPTIIIGYSMEDPGVLSMFENSTSLARSTANRWYLTRTSDEGEHEYYRSLGLTPVIGGTKEFLELLGTMAPATVTSARKLRKLDGLPQVSEISAQGLESYFRGDAPKWYDMYFDRIPHLQRFAAVLDRAIGGKNSLLLGVNYSGKTTMLMQLATYLKKNTETDIIFVDYLTAERANHLVGSGAGGYLIVDNCCSSIDGFNIAARSGKFTIVAADREFNYDISIQHLDTKNFHIHNISSLDERDLATLYSAIPPAIRRNPLVVPRLNNNSKPFALEFVQQNISYVEGRNWQKRLIEDVKKINSELSNILIMNCFVYNCRGAISDELLCSFLGEYSQRPFELMAALRSYLTETAAYASAKGLVAASRQDFYVPRSNLFADQVVKFAPDVDFSAMYRQFFRNVRSDVVPRWDNFRIAAYQVYYTKRVFPEWRDGKAFYDELFDRDQNYYDLQHAALYLSNKGQHKLAFSYIDDALQRSRNRVFSIRNTHAQVLFAANIHNAPSDDVAKQEVLESMQILRACLEGDRRSRNHAIVYGEQTLRIAKVLGAGHAAPYLQLAKEALEAEADKGATKKIRDLVRDLARLPR
ncbi:SIR2 family protein [Mesorhizobium sp. CO1-1-11]|uniref:SIR2 family protein n=1 Tax=Mesorhizobium sp. CO1-1-11 TaxID=2876636 RepID=UPI001CC9CF9B|nr:SIR2 family protein [Mesorhizobium sp. CO1-1-11]MBZ9726888.1 SIR2 family protein [Mesorhizobium sp. CO1-1-11]